MILIQIDDNGMGTAVVNGELLATIPAQTLQVNTVTGIEHVSLIPQVLQQLTEIASYHYDVTKNAI